MYPLPANATRIRYLQTTGTQYIDLPTYTLGQNTIVEVLIEAVETSGDIKLFGSHPVFLVSEYNSKWRFYQNVWTTPNVEVANATNVKVRSTSAGVELISNGETIYSNNNRARAADDLHPVIGGMYTASSGSISKGKGRYKGLRILEGSTIAHDYVPVRVGQVGYLFDRVSGQLFGNAGTGDFTLGPDTFQQGVVPTRMMVGGVRKKISTLDYIRDSAFLFFDGIENAGRGVHNSSATSWKDLSASGADAAPYGGCNATWTSDSLSFTETGNYRAPLTNVTWPSGGMTIEMVIRQNQYGTWGGRIIQTQDDTWKRLDVCVPTSTNAWGKQIVVGTNAFDVSLSKQAPPMAQTFAMTLSTTASGFTFRYNGQNETISTTNYPRDKASYLCIGGNYNNNRNFLGEVCAIRLHSRKLTDAEIDANAALDRQRFNLWPVPLYTGVSLVGSSVQNNNGILSGFTASSYATMPWRMTSGATSLEACIKFHWNGVNTTNSGIWGCVGSIDSFTPFYFEQISFQPDPGHFGCYLSSNGSSWTVGPTIGGAWTPTYPAAGDYILRLAWNGTTAKLLRWAGSAWAQDTTVGISSIYGTSNLVPQLGTNRGQSYPLNGTIDLNYTYLMRDGALLWEGVAGAYKRVKTTYPD